MTSAGEIEHARKSPCFRARRTRRISINSLEIGADLHTPDWKQAATNRRISGRVTRLPSPTDLVGVNFTDPHRFFVRYRGTPAAGPADRRAEVIKYSIIGILTLASGLTTWPALFYLGSQLHAAGSAACAASSFRNCISYLCFPSLGWIIINNATYATFRRVNFAIAWLRLQARWFQVARIVPPSVSSINCNVI